MIRVRFFVERIGLADRDVDRSGFAAVLSLTSGRKVCRSDAMKSRRKGSGHRGGYGGSDIAAKMVCPGLPAGSLRRWNADSASRPAACEVLAPRFCSLGNVWPRHSTGPVIRFSGHAVNRSSVRPQILLCHRRLSRANFDSIRSSLDHEAQLLWHPAFCSARS